LYKLFPLSEKEINLFELEAKLFFATPYILDH